MVCSISSCERKDGAVNTFLHDIFQCIYILRQTDKPRFTDILKINFSRYLPTNKIRWFRNIQKVLFILIGNCTCIFLLIIGCLFLLGLPLLRSLFYTSLMLLYGVRLDTFMPDNVMTLDTILLLIPPISNTTWKVSSFSSS